MINVAGDTQVGAELVKRYATLERNGITAAFSRRLCLSSESNATNIGYCRQEKAEAFHNHRELDEEIIVYSE